MTHGMAIRVGIDLVSVDAVEDAISAHADRYLRRVYTDVELADCATSEGVDPERLAARFAAKEATLKVLRVDDEAVPWQAIGVRRERSGAVDLELSGPAAELADRAGLSGLAVSLTHEGAYAAAVVVAELAPEDHLT